MLKIGEKTTESWGAVTAFSIGAPSVQTRVYNVPGRNGTIDVSESLTGYPVYNNRSLNIELTVYGKTLKEYQGIYDEVYEYCHGRKRDIISPFEPDYHYSGRLAVSAKQEDNFHGTITITGDMYPYALKNTITEIDISSESAATREVALSNAGMPTKLTITTDAEIAIIRRDSRNVYSEGTHVVYAPLLIDSETITVIGEAVATISYQEGKL